MTKIKVLYLITGLNTGGAEIMLENLLKKLDKEIFLPLVVSIRPVGEVGRRIAKQGIKVLSLDAKIKYNFLLFFRLFKIIKQEKPNIVHSHLFHANFLSRIIRLFFKKNFIIISTIHSINFGGAARELLLRATDKFCNITITVSKNVLQTMIKKKIAAPEKLKVIYNGIDIEKFSLRQNCKNKKIINELKINNNYPILISVGRLTMAKGYIYLFDAIKILKQKYPKISLIILGEGEERLFLEKYIQKLELEKNIFLLGNKKNVIDYLSIADFFILPSLWEGLPTAILEAMACGIPVIASKVGGVEEIIIDNYSGFLIEKKNLKYLADEIDHVANLSSDKIANIKKNSKRVATNNFSLNRMVYNYEKLYQELLGKYG